MILITEEQAALAEPVQEPIAMLDLRESAIAASPWAEQAERTGAFVKGAIWHAMTYAAPVQGLRIVFDGPPAPESGRFVEAENAAGQSVNAGEWRERTDGMWELVLYTTPPQPAEVGELVELLQAAQTHVLDAACESTDCALVELSDRIDAALAKLENKA